MGAVGADGEVGRAVWEGHASEKKSDRNCRTRGIQSGYGDGDEFLGLVEGLRKIEERIRRGKEGRRRSRSGDAMTSKLSKGRKGGRERDITGLSGLEVPEGGAESNFHGDCE